MRSFFFFINDTATTEIYTLSLHDALPIGSGSRAPRPCWSTRRRDRPGHPSAPGARGSGDRPAGRTPRAPAGRSEEHTSDLQSRQYLVCRLLLEKKHAHRNLADAFRSLAAV